MATFTTRVELHDAVWSDYTKLHVEMGKQGYRQTITAENGTVYKLPPGEYNLTADITTDQARDLAKMAAARVKPKFAVLVTKSAGRRWTGLERA